MTGQEMIARFHGSNQETALPGITNLDLLQAVLDEIHTDDNLARLVVPAPTITTVAGTLTYSFDVANDDAYTAIVPAVSDIRRIRGIWKPGQLEATVLSDYGYKRSAQYNQELLEKRLYDGSVRADNERRLVVFAEDPGTTTTTWKIDYYRKAPTVTVSRRIPVLHGWEMPLVLPGMKAVFEEWQTGNSGEWRETFERKKLKYFAAVQVERGVDSIDELDYIKADPFVEPT